MEKAIAAAKGGHSIRSVAKIYNVNRKSLSIRIKNEKPMKSGRPPLFDDVAERSFVEFLFCLFISFCISLFFLFFKISFFSYIYLIVMIKEMYNDGLLIAALRYCCAEKVNKLFCSVFSLYCLTRLTYFALLIIIATNPDKCRRKS